MLADTETQQLAAKIRKLFTILIQTAITITTAATVYQIKTVASFLTSKADVCCEKM